MDEPPTLRWRTEEVCYKVDGAQGLPQKKAKLLPGEKHLNGARRPSKLTK